MSKELKELRDQRGTEALVSRRGSTLESQSQGSSSTTQHEAIADDFDLNVESLQLEEVVVEVEAAVRIFKV